VLQKLYLVLKIRIFAFGTIGYIVSFLQTPHTSDGPVSTANGPQSLPEWALRVRPGLWRISLCPKVARMAEHIIW